MALFGVKEGLKIFGGVTAEILTGDFDPSVTGQSAHEGALFLKKDGVSYKKVGPDDTDWTTYGEIEAAGLVWESRTADFTATEGRGYIFDSSGGSFTATLDESPKVGDRVGFVTDSNAETNNITVTANGNNINGADDDLTIDLNYAYFEMLYAGSPVGWVISNTDESGNVNNIRAFIGNDDNSDPAVTEYTEQNYVTNGDSLESSIDLLDQKLKDISGVATAGVTWREYIHAITSDDPTTVTSGNFSDDDEPYWSDSDWQVGDKVVSTNDSQMGKVFEWDGSAWVDANQPMNPYDAVSVRFDLLDSPGSQEDGGAYMMNSDGDGLIKIADFDLETAATIALNDPYAPASGDPSSDDTIQSALQKIDANQDAIRTMLGGQGQGVSNLGNSELNYLSADTTVKTALTTLDAALRAADSVKNQVNATSGSTDVTLDTVSQGGSLGAKWFVMAYDGSGNRYAAEIYAMHNGGTEADLTEYAILELGTTSLSFGVSADGSDMVLTADNSGDSAVDIKIQRVTIKT